VEFLKDVYVKAAMALQQAVFGRTSDRMAVHYAEMRFRQFVDPWWGGHTTFLNEIGFTKPPIAVQLQYFTPAGGEGLIPQLFDIATGEVRPNRVMSYDSDAALDFNIETFYSREFGQNSRPQSELD